MSSKFRDFCIKKILEITESIRMNCAAVILILTFYVNLVNAKTCPFGHYLSGLDCKKCSPSCDGGRVMIKTCTKISDIICRCPMGKFWTKGLVYCKQCTSCRKGQIIVVNCTHAHNRQCVNCNPGTFAETALKCKPCAHCSKGMVTKQQCNTSHNTICETLLHVVTDPSVTDKPGTISIIPTQVSTQQHELEQSYEYTLLVVVIAVLSFLLILLGICFYRSRKRTNKRTSIKGKRSSIDTTSSENDTFINKKIMPVVTKDPGLLIRNMNPEILINLSRLLNPDGHNNWVQVAAHLQYTQTDINNFGINKEMAFQRLIEAWGTTREATIYKLYLVFVQMERDDCISILEGVLTREISSDCV